jgi:DnaJ-class molecular chaperone
VSVTLHPCPTCKGEGSIDGGECPTCNGDGVWLKVPIPTE